MSHKLHWDFEIQRDHLISPRRPDLVIVNNNKKKKEKRTCRIVDFYVLADRRIKLKGEKRDAYLDLARELKKGWKNLKETESLLITAQNNVIRFYRLII